MARLREQARVPDSATATPDWVLRWDRAYWTSKAEPLGKANESEWLQTHPFCSRDCWPEHAALQRQLRGRRLWERAREFWAREHHVDLRALEDQRARHEMRSEMKTGGPS